MLNKNTLIINFLQGQGLGNQLWVYYSGLYISQYLNCNIKFGNGKYFKADFIINDNRILYENIKSNTSYRVEEKYDYFFDLDVTDYGICLNKLKNLIKNNDVELLGTLQSTSLIPDKHIIKKTLKFNTLENFEICTVHIRGGDYKNTIVKPSIKYFKKSLEMFSKYPAKIITDDHHYATKILPNIEMIINDNSDSDRLTNEHHYKGGIKDDFFLIAKSDVNIISSSTFSFWASYIGSIFIDKKIVAPAYWYANRVSKNWWSPNKSYIKDWIYIDSKGKLMTEINISYPKLIKNKKQNKYIDFIKRKILNFYFNLFNK